MPYSNTEHSIGHGYNVAYSDDGTTYTSIEGTFDVTPPERQLGSADITNDDTADNHKDSLPGLFDPGVCKFSYHYGKTQYAAVEAVFLARTNKYWKITAPDSSVRTFRGYITKHSEPTAGQEEAIQVDVEIQLRTKQTFAVS